MNELSTKLYKLDFKDLINNATNRTYWTKKWTIFEYNGLRVEFTLASIEITDNKLIGRLELSGKEHRGYWNNPRMSITIPLEEANFNELALNRELVGKIDYLYLDLGERDLKVSDEYFNLKEIEDDFSNKLEEIAENFLDSHGIDNKSIRSAYIDAYVSENRKDYSWQYVKDNAPRMYVSDRATFAYIMSCDKKAESIIEESGLVDCDYILEEAMEIKQLLENDDMSEYQDKLEEI